MGMSLPCVPEGVRGGSYGPLSRADIERIHDASMSVIENIGFEVHNPRALRLFREHGAEVDPESQRVRAGRGWMMDRISKAPKRVVLFGREAAPDLVLEGANVYFASGGTALNVLDPDTGDRRPSTLHDLKQAGRLVDSLENIHGFVLPLFPCGMSKETVDVNRFYAGLCSTSKHVMGGIYSTEGVKKVIQMAEMIAGGAEELRARPFVSMITCVMSPLKLDRDYTDMMMAVAEAGIPVAIPSEPLSGATAPVTLAGTLVQQNAETLAGVALTQLINPGTPAIYGSVATIADMRTGAYLSGAVEMGLLNAAAAQMAQFYRLPFYGTAGMSDSKLPDVQAGFEKAITALLVALAGANFIHDAAGLLEFAMTVSFEQYVIDNEILGMVRRALRGFEMGDEGLAVEALNRVGPGGHFLTDDHTLRHFRTEFFYPVIADRSNRDEWLRLGAPDARMRARTEVRRILDSPERSALDAPARHEILGRFPEVQDPAFSAQRSSA